MKNTNSQNNLKDQTFVEIPSDSNLNDMSLDPELDPVLIQNINKVNSAKRKIKVAKLAKIRFRKPILYLNDDPVIYPNTINIIQGPAGSHKSRLAEIISAATILKGKVNERLLKFCRYEEFCAVLYYVDTERNIQDQFPFALQTIQEMAGYSREDEPSQFDFDTFLVVDREVRLQTLQSFVESLSNEKNEHLFVVLDVITDFIHDFNRIDQTMNLVDWMNRLINEYDITFLCIIHENPKSDKARGHVGTELLNKVSTAIQISPHPELEESGIYRIKFLKTRNSRKPNNFYVRYSDDIHGLAVVDSTEVEMLQELGKGKTLLAPIDDVVKSLADILGNQKIPRKQMETDLAKKFECTDKTITTRLTSIIDRQLEIVDGDNRKFNLKKKKEGREVFYFLQVILKGAVIDGGM